MTEKIREAVRIEMAKKKWNQTKLAEAAGLSRQRVSYLMRDGDSLGEGWQRIFEALGLSLKVEDKE